MHLIEPALALIGEPSPIASHSAHSAGGATRLHVEWASGVEAEFATLGNVEAPIELRVIGERGEQTLTFEDSFAAFKRALECFLVIARGEAEPIPEPEVLRVVELIELGMASGAP